MSLRRSDPPFSQQAALGVVLAVVALVLPGPSSAVGEERPSQATQGRLRFAVIGSFGCGRTMVEAAGARAAEAVDKNACLAPSHAAVADLVTTWRPDFVATTGGNLNPAGASADIDESVGKYYARWIGGYRGQYGPGADENQFFPCLGAGDWKGMQAASQPYLEYFSLPGNERYYDFVRGPIHFFVLNVDDREPDGAGMGSRQHAWFVRTAAASRSLMKVVIMHAPPFSSSEPGGLTLADWTFGGQGVDLVLCGRDRNYERIERDGLLYVSNGAGGGELQRFATPVTGSLVRYCQRPGALRVDVAWEGRIAELTASFVDIDGLEIDRFQLRIPARAPQPEDAVSQSAPPPPRSIRERWSLSEFYQQHADAGGIPVVGSECVSAAALRETAYVVNQMLAGRDDLREALIHARVRVAVLAAGELTTDIPEHADLSPSAYWNRRARGLGATAARPCTSCAEENVLLLPGDPYHGECILVHEFAHTVHTLGLAAVDSGFDRRLQSAYDAAVAAGLWKDTNAGRNRHEYWAEGVQSWFECNRSPDHSHNAVRTRAALRQYDPQLAALLAEVFRDNDWRYVSPWRRGGDGLPSPLWRRLPTFSWPAELQAALPLAERTSASPPAAR